MSKEQSPKTPQEVEDMRHIPYASGVGSLMYAMLCTQSDIYYVVGIISRYQSNPGHAHWTAVKNILMYLRRTRNYMLMYDAKDLILIGYTNSYFQTDIYSRKSTSHREIVQRGDVIVTKIASEHNIVDPFTKPLTTKVFEGHLVSLGLRAM